MKQIIYDAQTKQTTIADVPDAPEVVHPAVPVQSPEDRIAELEATVEQLVAAMEALV